MFLMKFTIWFEDIGYYDNLQKIEDTIKDEITDSLINENRF